MLASDDSMYLRNLYARRPTSAFSDRGSPLPIPPYQREIFITLADLLSVMVELDMIGISRRPFLAYFYFST